MKLSRHKTKTQKTFIDVFADTIPRSCFAAIILGRPKAKYKTQIGREFICKWARERVGLVRAEEDDVACDGWKLIAPNGV
jgi:hypothetical protein